jgi:hypothetical protein
MTHPNKPQSTIDRASELLQDGIFQALNNLHHGMDTLTTKITPQNIAKLLKIGQNLAQVEEELAGLAQVEEARDYLVERRATIATVKRQLEELQASYVEQSELIASCRR